MQNTLCQNWLTWVRGGRPVFPCITTETCNHRNQKNMQQHKIEQKICSNTKLNVNRVGRWWDSAVAIFRRLHIRTKPWATLCLL